MQQYMECTRGNYIIRGTIYIPEGASAEHPVPLTVLCHGFTADRNEWLFSHSRLAKLLCAEGIAAICFDFMGNGESDGEFAEMSVLTELEDVLAVLEYVRTLDYADQKKVALHGMSQGGLVACLAAAAIPDRICALSLWAPALCIPEMCAGGELLGVSMDGMEEKGYIDFRGVKLGLVYKQDGPKINVWEEVKKYNGPVQIVHGTADTSVDFSYSVRLQKLLGNRCILHPVEGADHDFESVSFNRQRLDHAVSFLKRTLL
ncbi:MAG: alpha/beta fold hydrolase [Clostridiales bacterium]|nr:alpha/beta fold hydrolase [Clostridiales bacterium]